MFSQILRKSGLKLNGKSSFCELLGCTLARGPSHCIAFHVEVKAFVIEAKYYKMVIYLNTHHTIKSYVNLMSTAKLFLKTQIVIFP